MTKLQEIQTILEVAADGKWGAKSQAALELAKAQSFGIGEDRGSRMENGGKLGYSERFLKMIPFLWEWEGTKFENDPDDPGGATKYGIDKRSHPEEDIPNLTETRATAIYWREYWLRHDCEKYAYPLGEVIFNCCVNAGGGRAQAILKGIDQRRDAQAQAQEFMDELEGFYRRLAAQSRMRQKFLQGWLNRTAALRRHLGMA